MTNKNCTYPQCKTDYVGDVITSISLLKREIEPLNY